MVVTRCVLLARCRLRPAPPRTLTSVASCLPVKWAIMPVYALVPPRVVRVFGTDPARHCLLARLAPRHPPYTADAGTAGPRHTCVNDVLCTALLALWPCRTPRQLPAGPLAGWPALAAPYSWPRGGLLTGGTPPQHQGCGHGIMLVLGQRRPSAPGGHIVGP